MDDAEVKHQLDLLRSTAQVTTWSPGLGGDALAGEPQSCTDVDFSMERQDGIELVIIKESKGATIKGDFLVKHIQKFENIVKDLDSIGLPTAASIAT